MSRAVTLVTPCHAGDLPRFALQRASIERCGVRLQHIVVVDHEDQSRFRDLPNQRDVTLVSTRDVLSRAVEARRRAYRLRRREVEWWRCRRYGRPVHGWGIQQIIKLSVPRVLGTTDAFVCMDTDTFFVRRVSADDFLTTDGRPHLYETRDDLDVEMGAWPAASMTFLGIKPTGRPLFRYTHSPVVMSREVVIDLQRHIESIHHKPWDSAFLDAGVTEYTTYGVYAREIDGLRRTAPTPPQLSCYFWWAQQVEEMETTFSSRVAEHSARIIGVQSNSGCPVSKILALAEPMWREVGNVNADLT